MTKYEEGKICSQYDARQQHATSKEHLIRRNEHKGSQQTSIQEDLHKTACVSQHFTDLIDNQHLQMP